MSKTSAAPDFGYVHDGQYVREGRSRERTGVANYAFPCLALASTASFNESVTSIQFQIKFFTDSSIAKKK
ncbi:hypothetical protein, partial [Halobacteriovorax sp. Y22]|uniref:hypothetical protein n=1 Tax=Halobacteriovorax sp. Y22 TaxID=2505978 RepID=UPI00197AB3F0